ncbi:MAG: leucine-rich repeat protein [Chitinispirillales bacterium]|jgi:uncharacterized repeat protein (TIGR02543 family)|nr:leucine-rich repeat protein [Chitinispirillales bacterium]
MKGSAFTKVMALSMLLLASATGFANTWSCGANVTATLTSGTLTISGSGNMTNYYLPSDAPWNYARNTITNVVIQNGVTSIGSMAFYNFSNLTSVTIPGSVTAIGDFTFFGCGSLTSVTIPNNVTYIGNGAFSGCASLTSVTIPDNVAYIGYEAFSGCKNLISVSISENVTSIEWGTFSGCSGLTSITIPAGVTSIEGSAFSGCVSLKSMISLNCVPPTVTSQTFSGLNLAACMLFVKQDNIVDYRVTDYWKDFGNFKSIVKMFTVTFNSQGGSDVISQSVVSGGKVGEPSVPTRTDHIFAGWYTDTTYAVAWDFNTGTVSSDITLYAKWIFGWDCGAVPGTVFATIDNGTLTISGTGAMANYTSTSSIPWYNYADSVINVVIEDGVTSIGAMAFYNFNNLISANISESVTLIGDGAFHNCNSLTSITIPDSVKSIGNEAFAGCVSLASITIPNSVTSIGSWAFYYCTGLESITIPDSVTSIENHTFYYCSGLTSVTIPNGVTAIGDSAFFGCSGLTSIILPSSVESIGDMALSCSNLTTVISLNPSAPVLSSNAFFGVDLAACTLLVPEGSVAAYSAANIWGDFGTIMSTTETSFTVTFDSRGGSGVGSQTVVFGGLVTEPAVPVFTNYIFGGWYTDTTYAAVRDFLTGTVSSNITLYAKWTFGWDCGAVPGTVFATLGNGVLTISGTGAMANYTSTSSIPWYNYVNSITDVVIEDGVTSIGNRAFLFSTNLTSVTIPSSVTSIGEYAFLLCTSLKSVTSLNPVPPVITYYTFDGVNQAACTLTVPQNGSAAYSTADYWKNFGVIISIVDTFTVTFDSRGGSGVGSVTVASGGLVTEPAIPVFTNYIFGGWYTDTTYTAAWDFGTGAVLSDITLYAKWTFGWDCGAVPGTVFATLNNGVFTISGTGAMANYSSPGNIPWYSYADSITGVVINDGVTTIGNMAFLFCDKLASITIPSSVASIGNYAFLFCDNLTSVTTLNPVPLAVSASTFDGLNLAACTLTVLPGSVAAYSMADYWKDFGNINYLVKIFTVTFDSKGGSSVSAQSVNIGTLVIEPAVPVFTNYIFGGWYTDTAYGTAWNFSTGVVLSDMTLYAGWMLGWDIGVIPGTVFATLDNGVLTISGVGAMANYSSPSNIPWYIYADSITSAVINEGVTTIGKMAFLFCDKLESVAIPSSVASIGDYAFMFCDNLTSVTSLNPVPPAVSASTFDGLNLAACTLFVLPGSVGAYSAVDPWKNFGNIRSTTGEVFFTVTFDSRGGSSVGSVSVVSGGLVIPPINPTLLNNLFAGWYTDTTYTTAWDFLTGTVSSNITLYAKWSLGWDIGAVPGTVFATFDNGVLTISGTGAMADYSSPSNIPWNIYADSIASVVINDGIISIGQASFALCSALTSVTIPNSVTSIGVAAFQNCIGLTSVTIPAGVTTLGLNAFSNCTGLTSVTSLSPVPLTLLLSSNLFLNVNTSLCTLYVPTLASLPLYVAAVIWGDFGTIMVTGGLIKKLPDAAEAAAPLGSMTSEFTAGPNPVAKSAGAVNFYRQGKSVENGTLTIFNASGSVVNRIRITDKSAGELSRRQIGTWNLKDTKGRSVSEGTYLVRGSVKTSDGKTEKVSFMLGVR